MGKNNDLQVYKQAKLAGNLKIFFTSFVVRAIHFKKLFTPIWYLIACGNAREMKWKGWKSRFHTLFIFIFKIFLYFCWSPCRFLALTYYMECPSQDMVQKFLMSRVFLTFSEVSRFYSNSTFWVFKLCVMFRTGVRITQREKKILYQRNISCSLTIHIIIKTFRISYMMTSHTPVEDDGQKHFNFWVFGIVP